MTKNKNKENIMKEKNSIKKKCPFFKLDALDICKY